MCRFSTGDFVSLEYLAEYVFIVVGFFYSILILTGADSTFMGLNLHLIACFEDLCETFIDLSSVT